MKKAQKYWVRQMHGLLERLLPDDDFIHLNGHFYDLYTEKKEQDGWVRARLWIAIEVVKSIPGIASTLIYWRVVMFRNTLKIAWRHVKRGKGHAFINVFGLAISIACCVLMFLWVLDEVSYDRFYPDADRIFRVGYYAVLQGNTVHGVQACPRMAPVMNGEFPEVEVAMRFRKLGFPVIRYGDKVFSEERWCAGDSLFFDVLAMPVIAGDPKASLEGLKLDLSQLFGGANPAELAAAERERALAEKRHEEADSRSEEAGRPPSKNDLDRLVDELDDLDL